jgi:hypothetical protein
MRFGTWNVRNVCRIGSLKIGASELEVPEVRWVDFGSEAADSCTFFYGHGIDNRHLWTGFFAHTGFISEVKRVGFISEKMSYIPQTGQWCDDIVLNVPAPIEDKSVDTKYSFKDEPVRVFDQFSK